MSITNTHRSESTPTPRTPDEVRQRLFTFLSRDDGTVGEIMSLTKFSALKLGYWMVGQLDHEDITSGIESALDRIDFADGASPARSVA